MNNRLKTAAIIMFLLLSATITGCGKFGLYTYDKGDVLVSVGDKKLYASDIQHLVNDNMTAEDSASVVNNYINNWITTEVKTSAAETALSDDVESIEELVDKYRRSLITYRYENEVISKQLDTLVTQDQVEAYYNESKDNFRLAGPIVKAVIVRLPAKLRVNKKFEDSFRNNSPESWAEFQAICQKNNYRLDDFSENWTDFGVVITHLPFTNSNFDEFLRTKKYYEVEDDQYKYMMKIISYRPTSDYSPIERETNNIRKILLNSRRALLIRNLEDSLVRISQDKIKRYN